MTDRRKFARLVLAMVVACLSPPFRHLARGEPEKDSRLAVPEGAALAAAEKSVREVFATEYRAKDSRGKAELAKRLFAASSADSSAPERFVLLRDARRIALAAGEGSIAVSAGVEEVRTFQVDELKILPELLNAKVPSDPAVRKSLLNASLEAIHHADHSKHTDEAIKFAGIAEQAFTRLKATDAAQQISDLRRSMVSRKQFAADYAAAVKTLAARPDDPDANLKCGKYACFGEANWPAGLPKLAAGSDPNLKELAARELTFPAKASEQMELASAWWDYSTNQPTLTRTGARARANHWYGLAATGLTGLSKTLAERRIAESSADVAETATAAAAGMPARRQEQRSVVFILDATKAMLPPQLERQRNLALAAVIGLKESQLFNIIIFNSGRIISFRPQLVDATPDMKKAAMELLDKTTASPTNAGGLNFALNEAFAERPQLIYVLSAFQFDGADGTLAAVRSLNVAHSSKINSIQFGDEAVASDLAKQLAQENGGQFNKVLTTQPTNDPRIPRKRPGDPNGAHP